MSDAVWTAARLAGWAVIIAVRVAFPGWPVYVVFLALMAGLMWLYRVNMRLIDEWYAKADRDS